MKHFIFQWKHWQGFELAAGAFSTAAFRGLVGFNTASCCRAAPVEGGLLPPSFFHFHVHLIYSCLPLPPSLSVCHFLFFPSSEDAAPSLHLFCLLSEHHFIISALSLAATRDPAPSPSLSPHCFWDVIHLEWCARTHTQTHTEIHAHTRS